MEEEPAQPGSRTTELPALHHALARRSPHPDLDRPPGGLYRELVAGRNAPVVGRAHGDGCPGRHHHDLARRGAAASAGQGGLPRPRRAAATWASASTSWPRTRSYKSRITSTSWPPAARRKSGSESRACRPASSSRRRREPCGARAAPGLPPSCSRLSSRSAARPPGRRRRPRQRRADRGAAGRRGHRSGGDRAAERAGRAARLGRHAHRGVARGDQRRPARSRALRAR